MISYYYNNTNLILLDITNLVLNNKNRNHLIEIENRKKNTYYDKIIQVNK